MNPKEYEKSVLITESNDYQTIINRVNDKMIRLLHSGLGLSSELAELENAVMDCKNGEIDYVNVAEEISDLMWYAAVAINALELDVDEILINHIEDYKKQLNIKNNVDLKITIASMVYSIGMFNDLLKKHLFYGKELDIKKIKGSLLSLSFSMSGGCYVCNVSPEKVREMNINKLKARYGQKFTEAAATNRDLDTEREILENGVK